MSESLTRFQPDLVLDARGLHCPLPLLKTKQALAGMVVGQVLEVRASDAGSWRDMVSFADQSGHVMEAQDQYQETYFFWIRKAGDARS